MKKIVTKLLAVLALGLPAWIGASAQQAEQAVEKDFSQRMERANPGFVPMRTMADEGELSLPAIKGGEAVSFPKRAADNTVNVPVIYGSIIASKGTSVAGHAIGMVKFQNDEFTQLNSGTTSKRAEAKYSGAKVGNNYYAVTNSGTTTYVDRFAVTNWGTRAAHSSASIGVRASDVAYDPTSDIVYGCFYNDTGDAYVFGKVDYATRVRTVIKELNGMWNAVMADADGQIYAIDMNGDLLKVNKTNGDTQVVGNTGVVPAYLTSATIDLSTGRCFWVAMPSTAISSLYEVNLKTGAATKLYDFQYNDELMGIYVEENAVANDAPAAAQSLTANFVGNSKTGTVTFKAPDKTFGGTAGTGNITYKLWVNGVLYSTGSVAYGEEKTVDLTVTATDKYYIVVAFSNTNGQGPSTRIAQFIGSDTPVAPAPTLSRDTEKEDFVISWPQVTGSVNGGYVNPDEMTYTIRRLPDDVVVAENIKETTYRDNVPETYGQMIPYRYSVKATFDGNTGAEGTTVLYPLGTIVPPYFEGFDGPESMNNFIVEDANGDNVTWIYSGGMQSAYINYGSVQHDDWLYTAAMYLTAGKKYTLNFEEMGSGAVERLEVKMGTAPTAKDMTIELVASHDVPADYVLHSQTKEFTVDKDGTYHIGFHAISDPMAFFLYVDNISVNCDVDPSSNAIEPPYVQTFDKSSVLSTFTVIDGNKDGRIWNINMGEARVGYGENQPMDDWLITPPMILSKDALYNIIFDTKSRSNSIEKFEVKIGKSNKVEDMTATVIPVTTVQSEEYIRYDEMFSVEEDGIYFIGIHGCSDPWSYELYLDNLQISAPLYSGAPDAATDGHVEGADLGELKANVSFCAPTKSVGGDNLTSPITKIEASYDGKPVASFFNVEPGQEVAFTATVKEIGLHKWTVVCSNEIGTGKSYEIEGYVGVGVPEPPTDVLAVEEGNTGKVTLTWKAPEKDVNGHALNPAGVTYIVAEIINGQQLMLAQNITETTYTLQASGSETQAFKTYAVYARTAAGNGNGRVSNSLAVGKPVAAPVTESAPNGVVKLPMGTVTLNPLAEWQMANDGFIGMNSYDSDNGYFFMQAQPYNSESPAAAINIGKIDLAGLTNPEMAFYTYNIVNADEPDFRDNNIFIIRVARTGEDYDIIAEYNIDQSCPEEGWNVIRTDLSAYAGQTITVQIVGVAISHAYTFLDCLSFGEAPVYEASELPAVTDLQGAVNEGRSGVELSWTAPDTSANRELVLTGYNIYRNESLLEGSEDTAYTDYRVEFAKEGPVSYGVTAVYKQGESLPATVSVDTSGIEDVAFDNIGINAVKGGIRITGAADMQLNIVSADGMVIYTGVAADDMTVEVTPGIYIVNVGGLNVKLVVR